MITPCHSLSEGLIKCVCVTEPHCVHIANEKTMSQDSGKPLLSQDTFDSLWRSLTTMTNSG